MFGLTPIENSPATWGARAIDDGKTFGLLPDRQSFDGEQAHVDALLHVLNKMGVLKLAQAEFGRLKSTGEIRGDVANLVTLYEDGFVKIEANTNASHGYVYVRGYIKPAGYTAKRVTAYRDDLPEDEAVWSCDELPEVGETIHATSADWASRDSKMVVLGYGVLCGHLHVIGYLPNPTEQWVEQAARNLKETGRVSHYNVMGREWARPMVVAQGYCEITDSVAITKIMETEDRETRREAVRRFRKGRSSTRHAHVTEVYMVLFRRGRDAMLVNRQYTPVGTMPVAEAKDLVARSVVGSVWEGYSLSNVPNSTGTGVWIAYPGSSDTRTWEAADSTAVVAAL